MNKLSVALVDDLQRLRVESNAPPNVHSSRLYLLKLRICRTVSYLAP